MKLSLWDILRTGQIDIPMPKINLRQILMEEHMNFLDFIHWPWWTMYAVYIGAGVLALIVLGAIKSLLGWPGLAALIIVLAVAGGELDGARRARDWAHNTYRVPYKLTDFVSIFK